MSITFFRQGTEFLEESSKNTTGHYTPTFDKQGRERERAKGETIGRNKVGV
jgi:hypothetical protein